MGLRPNTVNKKCWIDDMSDDRKDTLRTVSSTVGAVSAGAALAGAAMVNFPLMGAALVVGSTAAAIAAMSGGTTDSKKQNIPAPK